MEGGDLGVGILTHPLTPSLQTERGNIQEVPSLQPVKWDGGRGFRGGYSDSPPAPLSPNREGEHTGSPLLAARVTGWREGI